MNFNLLLLAILSTPYFIFFDQDLLVVQNRYHKLLMPLKIKPTIHYNLIIKTILK